jgi:hypothetical protein
MALPIQVSNFVQSRIARRAAWRVGDLLFAQ